MERNPESRKEYKKATKPHHPSKAKLAQTVYIEKGSNTKTQKGNQVRNSYIRISFFFYLQSLQHIRGWGVCNWKIMSVGEIAGN
jgi:hypothetical protein